MKTVGIVIFEGVASKNILRTDILPTLLARPDVRVVLFAKSPERVAYHQKEFPDLRITHVAVAPHRPKGTDAFFAWLKFFMLRTETTDMRRRALAGAVSPSFILASVLNMIVSRHAVQRFVRFLDRMLVRHACYGTAFDAHALDLIVVANIFEEGEVQFLREARRRGIPTIGFINSWDKTTARSGIRIVPDHFVVFNNQVRDELMRYHGIQERKIFAGGIPQYDRYVRGTVAPRDDFFRTLGVDPAQRLIVYSPLGGTFWASDWQMIDVLHRSVEEGRMGASAALLVRFPPNEFVHEKDLASRPWLRYDYPGVRFSTTRGSDWDMTDAELARLTDTLHHMSLLICYASSISVDAAVLDRPVININFPVRQDDRFGGFAVGQLYRLTHYRAALAPGGIRLADSMEELEQTAREYLDHPGRDREGRVRLAREQCGMLDGKAGERIGNFILNHLS